MSHSLLKRIHSKKCNFSYQRALLSILLKKVIDVETTNQLKASLVRVSIVETKVETLHYNVCFAGALLHSARHYSNDEYKSFEEIIFRIRQVLAELEDDWRIDETGKYSSLITGDIKDLLIRQMPLNAHYDRGVDANLLCKDIEAVLTCSLSRKSDMDTTLNLIGYEDNWILKDKVVNYRTLPMN